MSTVIASGTAVEGQLMIHVTEQGSELRILPTAFGEVKPSQRLHLGSQDLVRVAEFAEKHEGATLTRIETVDLALQPFFKHETEQHSRELVRIFHDYDGREVCSALQDDFCFVTIVGISLTLAGGQAVAHLRREGLITTTAAADTTSLMDRAWRELRLA